jgi:demethylmenaquinone methyltransferase/2-methoxy-6-polyprenyl-1,4-benzoquinol methylase
MRWLESAPRRYDDGMRLITLGRVSRVYDAVADSVRASGARDVLEIGCGTGAVTKRLIEAGARVTAVDHNPEMLEQARSRLRDAGPGSVEYLEKTAAEIDALDAASFDAVVASLSLSEMSAQERSFVLGQAARVLRTGGLLVVADEVRPGAVGKLVLYTLMRVPQVVLAWLVAGSISHPIADLRAEIAAAGFRVITESRWLLDSLAVVGAELSP